MDFIQNEIKEIKKLLLALNIQQKEILTIEEASEFLGLSTSRLYKMTSNKEIPHYKPGGKKIYLKRPELEQWITGSRVSTDDDCTLKIDDYLSKPLEN
ncbi:helix-turn-helix transcriptional regulator [Psychroserpens ponticola]|uniref:Helix-turn-helix domain-containing protein n=1 Tax=Psychroserpens ponticola TaxID=2932268 RepID=A0ABY7RXF9_9FLAO|nr:helix-turn-helix domain-containing protein [Psychroserpens ponticola]WCO01713.1 helix-turn-helix domain-containing protein [Psychroserpens ponticola]